MLTESGNPDCCGPSGHFTPHPSIMPPPQLRPAGAPAPTPAPTLYAPWKRNDVAASLATTVYYSGPLRQQQQSTSTSSAPATSS